MANKEEFDFDSFDFDDDDMDMGTGPKGKKPGALRKAVMSLTGDFLAGVGGSLKSGKNQGEFLKNALPAGYSRAFNAADETADSLRGLYDIASKETKGIMNDVKKGVNATLPTLGKGLPKNIQSKLDKWGKSADTSYSKLEAVDQDNVALQLGLADVFSKANARAVSSQTMNSMVQGKLTQASNRQLVGIRQLLERTVSYNDQVDIAYKRKSLELQYKSYHTLRNMLQVMTTANATSTAALEAIMKNTGLPDFVKINNVEFAEKIMKERMMARFTSPISEAFGTVGRKIMDRQKTKLKAFFRDVGANVQDGVMMAGDLAGAAEESGGAGRMAGSMGAGMVGNLAGGAAAKWVAGKIKKHTANNARLGAGANVINHVFDNGGRIFNGMIKSGNSGNPMVDWLMDLLGTRQDAFHRDDKVHQGHIKDLDTAVHFNLKARKTLTDIIPGFLARIHNEVQMIRTGDHNLKPHSYSFESGKFETHADTAKRVKQSILGKNVIGSAKADMMSAMESMDASKLSEGGQMALATHMAHTSTKGEDYNLAELLSGSGMHGTSDKHRQEIAEHLRKHIGVSEDEVSRYGRDGYISDQVIQAKLAAKHGDKISNIKTKVNGMGRWFPNLTELGKDQIDAGRMDHLEDTGMYKRDDNGHLVADHDAYIKEIWKTKPHANSNPGAPSYVPPPTPGGGSDFVGPPRPTGGQAALDWALNTRAGKNIADRVAKTKAAFDANPTVTNGKKHAAAIKAHAKQVAKDAGDHILANDHVQKGMNAMNAVLGSPTPRTYSLHTGPAPSLPYLPGQQAVYGGAKGPAPFSPQAIGPSTYTYEPPGTPGALLVPGRKSKAAKLAAAGGTLGAALLASGGASAAVIGDPSVAQALTDPGLMHTITAAAMSGDHHQMVALLAAAGVTMGVAGAAKVAAKLTKGRGWMNHLGGSKMHGNGAAFVGPQMPIHVKAAQAAQAKADHLTATAHGHMANSSDVGPMRPAHAKAAQAADRAQSYAASMWHRAKSHMGGRDAAFVGPMMPPHLHAAGAAQGLYTRAKGIFSSGKADFVGPIPHALAGGAQARIKGILGSIGKPRTPETTLESIDHHVRDLVKIAAHIAGGGRGDPAKLGLLDRSILGTVHGAANTAKNGAMWVGGKLKTGFGLVASIPGRAWRGAGHVMSGVGSIGGMFARRSDVYIRGELNPSLKASGMAEGLYLDVNSKKVITKITDITGPVMEVAPPHNYLITQADFDKGLVNRLGVSLIKGGFGLLKRGITGILGVYGNGFRNIKDAVVGTAKFLKKHIGVLPDVYVKGEEEAGKPRMLARIAAAGGYFDAATKAEVRKLKDITGDVVDKAGNVILTHDDIAKGLVHADGTPITGLVGKVKALAGKAIRLVGSAAKWGYDKVKSGVKLLGAGVAGIGNFITGGKGGFSLLGGSKKTVTVLEKIYAFMEAHMPRRKSDAHFDILADGNRAGSAAEQKLTRMQRLKAGISGIGTSISDKAKAAKDGAKGLLSKLNPFGKGGAGGWKGMLGKGLAGAGIGAMAGGALASATGMDESDGAMIGGAAGLAGKPLAKGAWGLTKMLGRGALAAGKWAMPMAGEALGGIAAGAGELAMGALAGVGAILTAPVLLAVGAAALIGGGAYLLYKHMNKSKATVMRFRMAQYGFDLDDEKYASKILGLEDKLLKVTTCTKGGTAKIGTGVQLQELWADFDVDVHNKKQVNNWLTWFQFRFKPVFITHVTELMSITGSKDLSKADGKLGRKDKLKYLKDVHYVGPKNNPYIIMASPFHDNWVFSDKCKYGYGDVVDKYNDAVAAATKEPEKAAGDAAKDSAKAGDKSSKDKKDDKGWLSKAGGFMSSVGSGIAAALKGSWKDVMSFGTKMENALSGAMSTISSFSTEALKKLKDGASSLGGYVADGAKATAQAVGNAASATAGAAVAGAKAVGSAVSAGYQGAVAATSSGIEGLEKGYETFKNAIHTGKLHWSKNMPKDLFAKLKAACEKWGIPLTTALATVYTESKGDPRAAAHGSSAKGLFQFIDGTWKGVGKGDRFNPDDSIEAGMKFTKANMTYLRKHLGREPEPWEIYMAHQQGTGGVTALTDWANGRPPSAKMQASLRRNFASNGGTSSMSPGEFLGMWKAKFSSIASQVGGAVEMAGGTTARGAATTVAGSGTAAKSSVPPMLAKQSVGVPTSSSGSTGAGMLAAPMAAPASGNSASVTAARDAAARTDSQLSAQRQAAIVSTDKSTANHVAIAQAHLEVSKDTATNTATMVKLLTQIAKGQGNGSMSAMAGAPKPGSSGSSAAAQAAPPTFMNTPPLSMIGG
jgi:hypothetical protein